MTDRRNLMLRLAIGLALVMLAAACTVPGPQGQRDRRGQREPQGQRDRRGQREPQGQRDRRGQREPQGQRDRRGQREPQGQRNRMAASRPACLHTARSCTTIAATRSAPSAPPDCADYGRPLGMRAR